MRNVPDTWSRMFMNWHNTRQRQSQVLKTRTITGLTWYHIRSVGGQASRPGRPLHLAKCPFSSVSSAELTYAKSIMDYLFRWMELRFLSGRQLQLFPGAAPDGGCRAEPLHWRRSPC